MAERLLLLGDLHLRFQRPVMRRDKDYMGEQFRKLEFVLKMAVEENCSVILQPGDFFDSVEVPWIVVKEVIRLLQDYQVPSLVAVRGQHDMRYHTRKVEYTPLGVLSQAGLVRILDNDLAEDWKEFSVTGCSWGFEIPRRERTDVIQILLVHKMVVEEKLWPGQSDYIYAKHLFRKYPEYDLFVCGDNHKGFTVSLENKHVVNCGSLTRLAIDQKDHQPMVVLYEPSTRDIEQIPVKVKPASKVFDLGRARVEKKREEELDLFVKGIMDKGDLGLDFIGNLVSALKKVKDPMVKGIVEEAMDGGR